MLGDPYEYVSTNTRFNECTHKRMIDIQRDRERAKSDLVLKKTCTLATAWEIIWVVSVNMITVPFAIKQQIIETTKKPVTEGKGFGLRQE